MSFFGFLKKIPVVGSVLGGAADIIQGNQTKQRNKGIIGQAYRENAYQQGLRQANIRQDSNESLNARGILSPGATPGPIGTALQQVAKSGGKKIAGSGVDPFLAQAGRGSVGAANTLAGGQNQQMTDQFAYEDLGLARGKSQAEQANMDQYKGIIGNAIGDVASSAVSAFTGGMGGPAIPDSAMQVNSVDPIKYPSEMNQGPMTGAYGLPSNPSFFGGSSQGTVVGDGSGANYSFHQ